MNIIENKPRRLTSCTITEPIVIEPVTRIFVASIFKFHDNVFGIDR